MLSIGTKVGAGVVGILGGSVKRGASHIMPLKLQMAPLSPDWSPTRIERK
jgi:hypothetical protein